MTWTRKIIKSFLITSLILMQLTAVAQNYMSRNVRISMFSSTPLEDIRAVSDKGTAVIVAGKREIAVQLPVKSLEFDKKLMQEHFNENYMESDKYPMAKFKGVIDQAVDLSKDGIYNVTVNGVLSVHGVDKKRIIPGKLIIKDGTIQINTTFKVACADHQIKIPKLVFTKIAELITISAEGKFDQLKE